MAMRFCEPKVRSGFMTAVVLVILVVASLLLLVTYDGINNYRTNATRFLQRNEADLHCMNAHNVAIGFMRTRIAGILGLNLTFQQTNPEVSQILNELTSKAGESWSGFLNTRIDRNRFVNIFWYRRNSGFGGLLDQQASAELTGYLNSQGVARVDVLGFPVIGIGTPSVFVVTRAELSNPGHSISSFVFGLIGPKTLNEWIYFTNRETRPGGSTIFFIAADFIDGPLRTHDYVNINNAGGRPTFKGTVEFLGIKNASGAIVPETSYSNFANMVGNPPYKLLSNDEVNAFRFDLLRDEYHAAVSQLVNTYNWVKNNRSALSGLTFQGDITVSFNHGQGANSYDVKISQGNVDYIIRWNPTPPNARMRRQGGGPAEEFDFTFNGVITTTGNLTIDGPSALSTYMGNYTLYAHGDVILRNRLIPKSTYDTFFTAREHSAQNGESVSPGRIAQIKDFLAATETSSMNIVARGNVRVSQSNNQRIDNMKIFASIFAFDGSFTVDRYDTIGYGGQLLVMGSIMQNFRGPVGTFNPSTGQILNGYAKSYVYDPRIPTGAHLPIGTPAKSQSLAIKMLGMAK